MRELNLSIISLLKLFKVTAFLAEQKIVFFKYKGGTEAVWVRNSFPKQALQGHLRKHWNWRHRCKAYYWNWQHVLKDWQVFWKCLLKWWKRVFSNSFLIRFWNFSRFCRKIVQFRWKRLSRGISFDKVSTAIFPPSAIMIKVKFFFQKNRKFCVKKANFIRLENSYKFNCILQQICNIPWFFKKNRKNFLFLKPKLWMFWAISLIQSHSTANLPPSMIFKKKVRKTFLIFETQNLNVLRNLTNSIAFYGKFART